MTTRSCFSASYFCFALMQLALGKMKKKFKSELWAKLLDCSHLSFDLQYLPKLLVNIRMNRVNGSTAVLCIAMEGVYRWLHFRSCRKLQDLLFISSINWDWSSCAYYIAIPTRITQFRPEESLSVLCCCCESVYVLSSSNTDILCVTKASLVCSLSLAPPRHTHTHILTPSQWISAIPSYICTGRTFHSLHINHLIHPPM